MDACGIARELVGLMAMGNEEKLSGTRWMRRVGFSLDCPNHLANFEPRLDSNVKKKKSIPGNRAEDNDTPKGYPEFRHNQFVSLQFVS
jgi:hypothetical protein